MQRPPLNENSSLLTLFSPEKSQCREKKNADSDGTEFFNNSKIAVDNRQDRPRPAHAHVMQDVVRGAWTRFGQINDDDRFVFHPLEGGDFTETQPGGRKLADGVGVQDGDGTDDVFRQPGSSGLAPWAGRKDGDPIGAQPAFDNHPIDFTGQPLGGVLLASDRFDIVIRTGPIRRVRSHRTWQWQGSIMDGSVSSQN
ncbi:hypothetical protein DESC_720462 [Desulfosarcina cetonica]|nr:hypothetical protein DESC_720462 [Desulfosarcina cetonica]